MEGPARPRDRSPTSPGGVTISPPSGTRREVYSLRGIQQKVSVLTGLKMGRLGDFRGPAKPKPLPFFSSRTSTLHLSSLALTLQRGDYKTLPWGV